MSTRTIIAGVNPASALLRDGTIKVEGVDLDFIEFKQLNSTFPAMVRDLAYDICEMAIATYLIAQDKGIPITCLPVALGGAFHHQSLVRLPESDPIEPKDLIGKKVAVRAYTQTTAIWVRGVLLEEFGINTSDITWVTQEGPHVIQYEEPSNVERTEKSIPDMLRDGDVTAALVDIHTFVPRHKIELVSIIPDALERQVAWGERHHTIPINHMLTVQTAMLESDPQAVRAVYQAFAKAIDATKTMEIDDPKDQSMSHGFNEGLMNAMELSIEYALEQGLISKKVTVEEIFKDSSVYL